MTFCNMTPSQAFSFSEMRTSCRQTAYCCMLQTVNEDAVMHPRSCEVERSNIFTDIVKYSLRTDYLQRNDLTLQQYSATMFKISQSMKKEGL